MNRSGHKHESHNKKQSKPHQTTRLIKQKEQPKNQHSQSRSKSKHIKYHKPSTSHKRNSPESKNQQYFKLSVYQQFPSKESSSLKANLSNDYCVNEYFVKNIKPQKKQPKSYHQNDHFNKNDFRTVESQLQLYTQEYGFDAYPSQKNKSNDLDSSQHINNKISNMMKKISFSDKRALINCDGKIVSSSKEQTKKSQLNKSNFHNTLSFSKQYLSKNQIKKKSKSKHKIKSKSKQHKLKHKQRQKQRQYKDQSREHKQAQEKLVKARPKDKNSKNEHITIRKTIQLSKQADKLYKSKHPHEPKHVYTESSSTLASKEYPKEQFYYYQRHPTSTTTIADHSSSSSSSSSFNLNTKPEYHRMIDFSELSAQISSQISINSMILRKEQDFKFKGSFYLQRLKCLNLIASICGELRTKRQTFSMAVYYFDKYVLNFDCLNMKLIALTCIMIALKMDIPELLPKYCFAFRPNPQATIKKGNKSHKKKKSEHGSGSSSLIRQKDSFLDTKDKISLLMTLPIYVSKDEYRQDKQEEFHIGQIIQGEIEVMTRLKFRFYYKTHAYWVDLLTSAWDQYMFEVQGGHVNALKSQEQDDPRVFFKRSLQSCRIKNQKNFKAFSYLNQTLQHLVTITQSYKHNPITITLSTMYLLVRLQLEERKVLEPLGIYKYYRENLTKSCNLIFCDSVGANQLFGNFLSKLNLNMALIVDTVQFVSQFIVPEQFKIWNYQELFGENYVDRLSNFVYNPNIFRAKTNN